MTEHAARLPSGPVDLTAIPADGTPGFTGDKAAGEAALAAMGNELADLQERLFAERTTGSTRNVLLVLQGMDTSGKGGTLRHTVGLMDPQGVRITSFKAPTDEEKEHDFLWRVRRALPGPGYVGVFDRSHYEDVLIVRVHGWRRAGGDRAAVRRHQRVRGRAGRRGHQDPEVRAAHLGRGAARAPARATRRSHQALEVQPRRPGRARAVAGVPRRLRDRARAYEHRPGALACDPERPASGTGTSRSGACCSTRCASSIRSGRRPTSTSTSSVVGSSTRRRSDRPPWP